MSETGTIPSSRRVNIIGTNVVARVTNAHDSIPLQVGGDTLEPGASQTYQGPVEAIGLGGDVPVTIESAPNPPKVPDDLNSPKDPGEPEPPETPKVAALDPPPKTPKPAPKRRRAPAKSKPTSTKKKATAKRTASRKRS